VQSFDSNTHSGTGFTVLLDIRKHRELEVHALRRELTNRCQQLRKKANLKATDNVDIFYEVLHGTETELFNIIHGHEDNFRRKVGAVPTRVPPGAKEQRTFLSQEDTKAADGEGDAADAEDKGLSYVLFVAERP
jgi:isoleucyl-tRNA synthetase